MHSHLNNTLKNSGFLKLLRLANATSVFKKGDKSFKNNYRPVSVLTNMNL